MRLFKHAGAVCKSGLFPFSHREKVARSDG